MKALWCEAFGPPEQLSVAEVPSPRPGRGQVVVRVEAASLNFPDALMVQGLYQVKPRLPFAPGAEFSGVVEELGEGVTRFAVGDDVIALTGWGGFAQQCVVEESALMALPQGMTHEIGAAFALTCGTALHALKDRGGLREGETLLVLGAAGGAGSAAVEIGRLLGARVIAAASSEEKLALCRELGAHETIDYAAQDLRQRALELTGNRGVDVVFDPVGGALTEAALRATAWRGRLLVIGFAAGEIPRIPLNLALLKERSLVGVYWGDSVRHDPAGHQRNLAQLLGWFAGGKLRPAITERVPLALAARAMRRMLSRQVRGKVVVLPQS